MLLFSLLGAFAAPIIHEMVRVRVSAALGDTQPYNKGFLTWNPIKFFEPIGFVLMLLFNVGWARPTPLSNYHYRNRRSGMILTYTMPIVVSLFIGVITLFLWQYIPAQENMSVIRLIVRHFAYANISVAIINTIIPVFPFGANALLKLFVSPEAVVKINHNEKMLQIIFIFALVFGLISRVINPILAFIATLIIL